MSHWSSQPGAIEGRFLGDALDFVKGATRRRHPSTQVSEEDYNWPLGVCLRNGSECKASSLLQFCKSYIAWLWSPGKVSLGKQLQKLRLQTRL